MSDAGGPRIISVIGRKNSGKTTLVVALAAELGRRGWRIASVKHGHHDFEIDQPGRDSWRHFHEGRVEAVMMISSGKIALISRCEGEPDPAELIRRHLSPGNPDLILVEGYKHGPFMKLEIHRSEVHQRPIHDPGDPAAAALFLALITDRAGADAACTVIPLHQAGEHVDAAADLIERILTSGGGDAG